MTIHIIKFSPKTSFINNSLGNSFFLWTNLFESFNIFFGIFLSFEIDLIHSSFELFQQFITTFHLLLVVVDIIIFPHSLVGGGSISNEVEMVHDENQKGWSHDSAHHYQKEEDRVSHEKILNKAIFTWTASQPLPWTIYPFKLNFMS